MTEFKQYGFGSLGNGITVFDRTKEEHGDYKKIAHIDIYRNVEFYPKRLNKEHREYILFKAKTMDPNQSATQEGKVFFIRPNVDHTYEKNSNGHYMLKLATKPKSRPTIHKGESWETKHSLGSTASMLPYYFELDGRKHFIANLPTSFNNIKCKGDQRQEMARRIFQLRKNDFKFLRFYCHSKCTDPLEFIEYVKENNWTIQIHNEILEKCDTFTDLKGNLWEVSCSFKFRIYNDELLGQIKEALEGTKKKYLYKRD